MVGMRRRQGGPVDLRRSASVGAADPPAVVVEHGHAVGGEPHVALEPGGAQPEAELEGLDGVLGGVGPCATVRERDRGAGGARAAEWASGHCIERPEAVSSAKWAVWPTRSDSRLIVALPIR